VEKQRKSNPENVMNPTTDYEQIDLRKVLAEIDNLRAETLKMQSETKTQIDEREKLRAEARKMQTESKWHPLWVGAAIFGAGAALATALVGIMKTFL